MREQTKKTVTYGKSRSGNSQNVMNKQSKASAPRATNQARKDPKSATEPKPSNCLIPSVGSESGHSNKIDAHKSPTTTAFGNYSPDTRDGECGGLDIPRRKRINRTAPVSSTRNRGQISGVDTAYDFLDGGFGDSRDSGSNPVARSRLQPKNDIRQLHGKDTWKQHQSETLGFDRSATTSPAGRGPTHRRIPSKRKSPATPSKMDSESSRDPPSMARKHQNTGRTRKRLVDSLGPSEDSTVDKFPFSAQDKYSDTSNRRYHPAPRSNIHRSEDASPAKIPRQPPSPSSMLRGSRVTYARQRSFLDDTSFLDSIGVDKSAAPSESHDLKPSRSSELHSRLLDSGDDDDNEKVDSKPVRSIHELRQAGENARFRETVELILEDIEDSSNSISERCDGYIRLCIKLLEPPLVRQFCACDFEERLMESTSDNLDIISASLAFCAYSLIINSGYFSLALSGRFWWKIMEISPQLLALEVDFSRLVDQHSTSIARSVRLSLRKNLPRILAAVCGEQSSNTSPCFLALSCVNMLLLHLRQKVRSVEPISTPLLARLVSLLLTNPSEEGLAAPKFDEFALVLSILDSYTVLSSGPWNHNQRNSFGLLCRLRWLLFPNEFDQTRKILGLYLRVIMNVTNADPALCKGLATPELVAGLVGIVTEEFRHVSEDSLAKENSSLNILILALGALTNLAEKNESSRAVFLMSDRDSASFFQRLLLQFSHGTHSLAKVRRPPGTD